MTVWMHAPDQFSLSMVTPRGHVVERIPRDILGPQRIRVPVENTVINVEYSRERSWNGEQAAVIRLERPSEGLSRLYLYGDTLLDGTYDIYMPLRQWLRPNTRFLKADPAGSVTIPGTAASPVTVGGYNHLTSSLYPASGRGPTRLGRIKPDVAAPSVGIYGPVSPDGYQARSGTSGYCGRRVRTDPGVGYNLWESAGNQSGKYQGAFIPRRCPASGNQLSE